ncbi:SMR family transporter [Sphingopyxis terrae]|uniref:SMR family transporter n=1 Tax=Sphingopyxis terrae TaxID=33052 RepID=UPI00078947ED|nr:SMR family transporter [Sphingopyxis terrae]
MHYVYLTIAIAAEVIATSFLRLSDGFTKPLPTLIVLCGYAVAFYLLSLTLRTMPTGVVYAIWSGAGIVLIAAIAWIFQGQRLDLPAMLGMALILAGVVVLNVFSRVVPH